MGKTSKKLAVWSYIADVIRLFCKRNNISITDFTSLVLFTAVFHDRTAVIVSLQDLGFEYDEANELAAQLYYMLKEAVENRGSPKFNGAI